VNKLTLRLRQLSGVIWKNVRVYYTEPPVLIFGIFFPFCLFLAFAFGRGGEAAELLPAFLGITLFFTGSSVGPFITPWETQTRTLERMLTTPAPASILILGDVLSGFIFGFVLNSIFALFGTLFFGTMPVSILALLLALLAGSLGFGALGSLFAALPTDKPSNVMMLANLVRLPLIFLSGVFIPLEELTGTLLFFALLSPLTYIVDLLNYCYSGSGFFAPALAFLISGIFALTIFAGALTWHKRSFLVRL